MSKAQPQPLIPKSLILRWLQESADNDDFKRRLDHYVETHNNWDLSE